MAMSVNEICYRLQAMSTMCIFKDAVGHDLSPKEIKAYNQAKDIAIEFIKDHKQCLDADMVTKKKISQAINKISKCSMGKWYVGRLDGKPEEVVLLDDVMRILNELIKEKEN